MSKLVNGFDEEWLRQAIDWLTATAKRCGRAVAISGSRSRDCQSYCVFLSTFRNFYHSNAGWNGMEWWEGTRRDQPSPSKRQSAGVRALATKESDGQQEKIKDSGGVESGGFIEFLAWEASRPKRNLRTARWGFWVCRGPERRLSSPHRPCKGPSRNHHDEKHNNQ